MNCCSGSVQILRRLAVMSLGAAYRKQLYTPVCWRHILSAHWTQYESVESLIEAQVAYKTLAHQLSASTTFGITVTQLPHGEWTRQFHLRGLCSLL